MGEDELQPLHRVDVRLTRLEEQHRAAMQATQVQAKEYERRLGELNHAHEQAREVLGTYLPRETWEAWVKEEAARRDRLIDDLQAIRTALDEQRAATGVAAATNTRLVAAAGVVVAVLVAHSAGVFG